MLRVVVKITHFRCTFLTCIYYNYLNKLFFIQKESQCLNFSAPKTVDISQKMRLYFEKTDCY